MMRSVVVKSETLELIKAEALYPFHSDAVWVGGGWAIPMDEQVYARLLQLDTDIDAAIRLACSGQFGRA